MKGLFSPKTIAVIGASREAGKVGFTVFDNLKSSYRGKVFPVNPNTDQILGEKTYPTVQEIEGKVDLAVICVPAKIVPKVLESCGKKNVKYVIVISAGFSEAKRGGKELEEELEKIIKKHNMRLLGPNCLGVINNFNNLNASFASSDPVAKYRVGIFSQSGAMGAAMLDYANGNSFGFSYFVSLGNKMDISEIDLLEYWANDNNVAVGVGYLEDIKDGAAFLSAAKKFVSQKPLVILKGGMSKTGEKAANLHTAALAQDEVVFRAAMEEAGVILAENMEDLFELSVSFAVNPLPKGRRLAIISNAGGPSVVAADACDGEKVSLAKLSSHTIHYLASHTEAASIENPIDLRGDASSGDFKAALSCCQKDRNVDGILVIATPQAMTEIDAIAWETVRSKKDGQKPIYVNFIGGARVSEASATCRDNGVAVFFFPERAVRAFRFQADYEKKKGRILKKEKPHKNHKAAASIIRFSGGKMSYGQISSLLSLYDIKMAETDLVKSEKEAEKMFSRFEGPVVMKISSPDVSHKTDVGGVVLGVMTKEGAKKAYQDIIKNVKRHLPEAKIDGVTMMESAKEGIELILGGKRDKMFGPVVMFGFGGIYVELISDFAVALGECNERKARELIGKTVVSKIIEGYRKDTEYNVRGLTRAIIGMSKLISSHPEISSIEINPLILEENGRGVVGLDAKISLAEKGEED